jgi:hypothetical protein
MVKTAAVRSQGDRISIRRWPLLRAGACVWGTSEPVHSSSVFSALVGSVLKMKKGRTGSLVPLRQRPGARVFMIASLRLPNAITLGQKLCPARALTNAQGDKAGATV